MTNSIYCVKCRRKTDTDNIKQVILKNGRPALNGICAICQTKKFKFLPLSERPKSKRGRGLVNKAINNLPFELHLPGHNFTGPGTNLKKRLNPDLTPKAWSQPINRVDKAAYNHDICYMQNNDTKTRNEKCDVEMLKELKGIYNPTMRERFDRSIVTPIIGTKKRFGMGLNNESKKKNLI